MRNAGEGNAEYQLLGNAECCILVGSVEGGMMDDHTVHGAEAQQSVSAFFSDPLRGFWDERNNIPSKPVLVQGDEEQFERDKRRARARARHNLNRRLFKWEITDDWPGHLFAAKEVYA